MAGFHTSPYSFLMQEYFTTKEAADYLRYSVKTLEDWRAKHIGPPYKRAGRKILYSVTRLEEWVNSHEPY